MSHLREKTLKTLLMFLRFVFHQILKKIQPLSL